MDGLVLLTEFLQAIQSDVRIGANHISVYAALVQIGFEQGSYTPVLTARHELMVKSKILGKATYHKYVGDLNDFGYIRYIPSFNHRKKSKFFLNGV
ncbi:MAG: hypothetical protein JSU01_00710 [Bacteroidetes bacterium]|nr:hypothetical protein [Bacteroidota bacterium]